MLKTQVIGNLGKDCVVNSVNGKNVINFTVAHTEKWKDQNGTTQEKTTWLDCAYWTDKTAIAPYLIKGTQVYVDGTPEVKTFTRNDGTAGASLTLRVREIQLLGRKPEGAAAPAQQQAAPQQQQQAAGTPAPAASATDAFDDLPF